VKSLLRSIVRHVPVLLLALWFGGMSVALDRAVALFGERTSSPPSVPAPAPNGRLFVDPDSYAWLSFARDLRESPHFRVRFTHMDNAPFGRPVHWAQLPVWGLCAIAAALETAGISAPGSLELAGRVLLPLLGFLSFSALWLFLRRRVPPALAAGVVLAAAVVLFWNFHPLRPDHHGFHLAAAAAFALPLLFSSFGFAPPTRRDRLPFLVSGFFGGVALWLGATVFFFVFAATVFAAALAVFPRRPGESLPRDPAVWRLWGLAGAGASLLFWLLEYAPSHFSMRLEANHPLYALSFLGAGECLRLFAAVRHDRDAAAPTLLPRALLAFAAAAALPALVLFGPDGWYIPRSALMLRLHARHIQEFFPLSVLCASQGRSLPLDLLLRGLPAWAALPFLLRRPFRRDALFAVALWAAFLPLCLWQNRWEQFFVLFAFLPLLAAARPAPPRRAPVLHAVLHAALHAALLAALAAGLWRNLAPLPAYFRGTSFDPAALHSFQCRALAVRFRGALRDPAVTPTPLADSPALLGPADLAPFFWYSARIPSLSSFYWENLPGDADAAAAFADPSPGAEAARSVVASRRLSHLLVFEGARDALLYADLRDGVHSKAHAARTLAGTLSGAAPGAPLPPWLGVDPALNRLANPPLRTFIPGAGRWAPHPFAIRIYSLRAAF